MEQSTVLQHRHDSRPLELDKRAGAGSSRGRKKRAAEVPDLIPQIPLPIPQGAPGQGRTTLDRSLRVLH